MKTFFVVQSKNTLQKGGWKTVAKFVTIGGYLVELVFDKAINFCNKYSEENPNLKVRIVKREEEIVYGN